MACARAGPQRDGLNLADVLRAALAGQRPALSPHHRKILNTLLACQTPQLGGHIYRCENCGREHFVPRSCGNRHCPNCQWHQAMDWLKRQEQLLLPIPYFHVVFTLPHTLNPIIRQNQAAMYKLLFWSASQTLLEFGRNNLGAQLGLTLVLHTWSQTLIDHYHVHCIVTGGGMALEGLDWKTTGERFLFPVHALAIVFQAKFCAELQRLFALGKLQFHKKLGPLAENQNFQAEIRKARAKSWNVYAKRPFAGPKEVLEYLSRYTHRVAITNRRLTRLNSTEGTVGFSYKARRDKAPPIRKEMKLELPEFLRRFCLHILPERFVKIRHYGLLANRGRQKRVDQARVILTGKALAEEKEPESQLPDNATGKSETGEPPRLLCPYCGRVGLVLVETVRGAARAPPNADLFAR